MSGSYVLAADSINLDDNFIVKPYLQLGNHPLQQKEESLELLWITDSNQDSWEVQTKSHKQIQWLKQKPAHKNILSYSVPEKLYLWDNPIDGLEPGEKFQYKVSKNGKEIFAGESTARKTTDQPFRIVLFGDTGADTLAEKKVVYQSYLKKPDVLVILGDIAYSFGRLSEYLSKFFPIFSSDQASAQLGAPLLQSTITIPVIGNHDIAYGDNKSGINFDKLRDALAYYQVWSAPLNGPLKNRSEKDIPKLLGSEENINRYVQSTDGRYPAMSNYSFDYGNSHWLILDANPYMSWTNQKLRNWVRQDLITNKDKTWKFVCFHQPGFSIDKVHSVEQRMRLLSDIFQECGVDIVFSGHAHNYQKSFPLLFRPLRTEGTPSANPDGTVSGEFVLDKLFDGKKNLHPIGVIYMVSGAGGAALYGAAPQLPNATNFTDKFNSSTHSLTLCEINRGELKCSQIDEDGKIIDSFKIQK
jgi:acid phosphatase type 7